MLSSQIILNRMRINIHRSEERKVSEFDEAVIRHNFNFGSFFNPLREKFGVLRVLNDELLMPGFSFNERVHKHIEILLFPLSGSVCCKDSTGTNKCADKDSTMLISTGSGFSYTVCNSSQHQSAGVIEVWIFARKNNSQPTISVLETLKQNRISKMQLIASGDESDGSLNLNQNAFIWRLDLSEKGTMVFPLNRPGNMLLIFVVKGSVVLNDNEANVVNERDSLELSDIDTEINIVAIKDSELLIIEVPVD